MRKVDVHTLTHSFGYFIYLVPPTLNEYKRDQKTSNLITINKEWDRVFTVTATSIT